MPSIRHHANRTLSASPTSTPGNGMTSDPVAMRMFLVGTVSLLPSFFVTVTSFVPVIVPRPSMWRTWKTRDTLWRQCRTYVEHNWQTIEIFITSDLVLLEEVSYSTCKCLHCCRLLTHQLDQVEIQVANCTRKRGSIKMKRTNKLCPILSNMKFHYAISKCHSQDLTFNSPACKVIVLGHVVEVRVVKQRLGRNATDIQTRSTERWIFFHANGLKRFNIYYKYLKPSQQKIHNNI